MELPILTKLREELQEVERELRVDVPRELRTAAAHGDLRENSEYDRATPQHGSGHQRRARTRISATTPGSTIPSPTNEDSMHTCAHRPGQR